MKPKPNDYDWMAEEAEWVFVPVTATSRPGRRESKPWSHRLLSRAAVGAVLVLVAWATWTLAR